MTEFENLVLKKFDALEARLSTHMEVEEDKIEAMGDKFICLQQTVSSYGDKQESMLTEMQKAFLEHETETGQRDYSGHYNDHKTRKRWYDRWAKWIEDGVGNLVKVAIASGAVWFAYELWAALLKGPK